MGQRESTPRNVRKLNYVSGLLTVFHENLNVDSANFRSFTSYLPWRRKEEEEEEEGSSFEKEEEDWGEGRG